MINKNDAEGTLSRLTNVRNQKTTYESNNKSKTMPDLYDTKDLPEGTFSLTL